MWLSAMLGVVGLMWTMVPWAPVTPSDSSPETRLTYSGGPLTTGAVPESPDEGAKSSAASSTTRSTAASLADSTAPSTAASTAASAVRSTPSLTPGSTAAEFPKGQWPIDPAGVTAEFDPPESDYGSGHRGLDLTVQQGQEVVAAAEGVITFAAPLAGRGVVVVDHGEVRTTYEPVTAEVAVGEQVSRGQRIGTISLTAVGHCTPTTPCLHWGLKRGDEYLDPRLLIPRGQRRIVLVAWDD